MSFFSPHSYTSTTPSSITHRGHPHIALLGVTALTILTTLAGAGVTATHASTPITLVDNTAVVVSSTGTIYRVDLATGILTQGETFSEVTGPLGGIEAQLDPPPGTGSLFSVESARRPFSAFTSVGLFLTVVSDGSTVAVSRGYNSSLQFYGMARSDSGTFFVSYLEFDAAKPGNVNRVASVDVGTGNIIAPKNVTLAGVEKGLAALVTVGDSLYAFLSDEPQTGVYSVDIATGALTEFATITVWVPGPGELVSAADLSSDGTLYFLTNDQDTIEPTLHAVPGFSCGKTEVEDSEPLRFDPAVAVPDISVFAIATTGLESCPSPPESRGDPAPEPENAVVSNSGLNSSPRGTITTPPVSPVLAPTGAAPAAWTWLGVLLFLGGLIGLLYTQQRIPR